MTDIKRRERRYRAQGRDQAIAWQRQLRDVLFELLQLNDLRHAEEIPFDAETIRSEQRDGYAWHELTLNATSTRRMEVVVTLPDGSDEPTAGCIPAVVCIHGHGGSRFDVHDPGSIYQGFAAALAANGYATIATEVGQHEVWEEGRTLMGERLWDTIRCVGYLAAQPQIDASRIGCAGLSLGGEMAMYLGALDERIAVEVSSGFLTIMDQMEEGHCLCWKFEGLRDLVDYADIYALTAPRPLMCQNGWQEPEGSFVVPLARQALEEITPIYRELGHPDRVVLQAHDGGHVVDLPSLLAFFDKYL